MRQNSGKIGGKEEISYINLLYCCTLSVHHAYVKSPELTPLIINKVNGGGGGNRTRVRRYYTHASTCVGCLLNLGIQAAGNQASGIPISLCLAAGSGEIPGSQPADRRYPRDTGDPKVASCFN
jgi:hypothetical protein